MAKTLAIIFGVIFVLVGLLGFVPNPLVGANALFDTNTTHDLVHLIIGIVLLLVAFYASAQSALWLKIIGAIYLVVALLGFFTASPLFGLVEVNDADNWLHIVLGIVLIAAGYWAKEEHAPQNMGGGMNMPPMQRPSM